MVEFLKRFFLKLVLILIMAAGALGFFIGALGVINPGFRQEVRGAVYFLLIGLGLMIASWALQRVFFPPVSKRAKK